MIRGGVNIRGERIVLRAVEPSDIDFLYSVENDICNWGLSDTKLPFSRYILERFVESQAMELETSRQLRLMVCLREGGECIGTVDLFDYDGYNHRAGLGIFISDEHRRQGYAQEVLSLVGEYSRSALQLRQIYCDIEVSNEASLRLFLRCGYERIGVKRDWLWRVEGYEDVVMMQKFLK